MMADMEPCSPSSIPDSSTVDTPFLHPRREPFEYGLLPIPKLIFSDPCLTLAPIKDKLLKQSSESLRVSSSVISEILQISVDHSRLLLDTIAAVLHCEGDSLINAKPDEIENVGANVYDLTLFLYIQSYKRLLPRTHKDAASVADVWPSTSAFDGYLSALSPLQLVRSNSRRFMPSQADEEAHQLSYLQKHLANILSLLADHAEDEDEESLVISMERFDHLGFLIHFVDVGGGKILLRQSAPFFANSHPDMPAAPVSATLVHDWLIQQITTTLEHLPERVSSKENGPSCPPDCDVPMSDASISSPKPSISSKGPVFIEGISKSSFVKHTSDLKGHSVKVLNCHDSAIYVLAPLRYATVYGCSDSSIVLGAVGKALRVEHCERVHVLAATKRICIANCRECIFFLGVNHQPLIIGDNHKLQVAPYNAFYPQLEEHMAEVGIEGSINRWNEPMGLGVVDPHDSLSHPAGVSDIQTESASKVDPEQLGEFLIPNWLGGESAGATVSNPFPLPTSYVESQQRKHGNVGEMKKLLKEAGLEESRKKDLSCALHVHFKDWLYATGNVRQLYCLQAD